MANIFLDANDTFTLPSTNTGDTIFGRAGGNETVILQGNPTGTTIDGNVEVVQVAGTGASTTLQVNASGQLQLVSGGVVYATFSSGLNQNVNLQFTDGNVTLKQTGAGTFTIENPANAANNVTINSTTPQAGSAVTLGPDQSTAGGGTTGGGGTGGGGTAGTFTLTATADTFPGTAGNDTFVGVLDGTTAANTTLSASDNIDGAGGTDTFNIILQGGATANVPVADVRNVETISVRNASAAATAVDGNGYVGATTFVADRSAQNITFNNIGKSDVTINGNDVVTNGNVAVNAGSATTDELVLNLTNGVNAGTFSANDANSDWTSVVINSTGGTATSSTNANVLGGVTLADAGSDVDSLTINATSSVTTGNIAGFDVTGTDANKAMITVTGAGAANIGALNAAVEKVVATSNTGGVTLTASTQTDFSFAGSSGDDRVTTNAVLGTGGSVDAAGGTGDRLTVANSTHITETVGAKYTNFEVLQVQDAVAVDLDHVAGITSVRINDGNNAAGTSVTDLSATQAGAITVIGANATGAITIGVKGAATVGQIDTVKITVDDGAAATNTLALGTPVINDVENLELTAVDNITVAALTSAESLSSIKLAGAGTISLTSGMITPEPNTVVDGSAATGALTINFGGVAGAATTAATSFIGGTVGDTITTTGGAADVVNGKGGIDSITVTKDAASSGFADVQSEAITSTDADLITGFVTLENDFDYNGTLSNGTGAGAGIAATEVASAANIAAALATGDAGNDIVFIATTAVGAGVSGAINTFKGAANAANADAIEAALVATGGELNGAIANLDTVLGASDSVLFQFSDADDTIVLRVTNTDTTATNTLTAAEIELVGVFGGTAALVAADYV